MTRHAALLLPETELSECLFGAIIRDTRGVELSDTDRTNYFPASPLITVTWVIEGETRMANTNMDAQKVRVAKAIAPISVTGPSRSPLLSWNPRSIFAVSIGFFPDAWQRLTGHEPSSLINKTVENVPSEIAGLLPVGKDIEAKQAWSEFQSRLSPIWSKARSQTQQQSHYNRLSDWARTLVVRSMMSENGKSVRGIQRRFKRLSGQSQRSIEFFSRIESTHELAARDGTASPAKLALDAGYSDQSHMGRSVQKATGFSPVQLNKRIEQDEAFWCYRLLGERF